MLYCSLLLSILTLTSIGWGGGGGGFNRGGVVTKSDLKGGGLVYRVFTVFYWV